MAMISDQNYLIHSFQLNFIRSVLPNHAATNLISFPSHSSINSPYINLSGLADSEQWPELLTGRNSPPLGLAHARVGAGTITPLSGGGGRRGGTGLQYSQTIGKGVVAAGMRVDGPRRGNWRQRGQQARLELDTTTAEESGADGSGFESAATGQGSEVRPTPTLEIPRRGSLEATIHHRRFLSANAPHPSPNPPPPVVIHSPVRTPQDSPISLTHSVSAPPSPSPPIDQPHQHSKRSAIFIPSTSTSYHPPQPGTPISDTDSQPIFSASPSDGETAYSLPAAAAPNLDSPASPLQGALARQNREDEDEDDEGSVTGYLSGESEEEEEEGGPASSEFGGARAFESVASSGVSLFGASTILGTQPNHHHSHQHGGGKEGDSSSQSDTSSFSLVAPKSALSHSVAEQLEIPFSEPAPILPQISLPASPSSVPNIPNIPIPARFRTTRERRRVNISGRMLVPISEPPNEEDHSHHHSTPTPPTLSGAFPLPPTSTFTTTSTPIILPTAGSERRPRSNTDPNSLTTPNPRPSSPEPPGREGTTAIPDEPSLRRKYSAPSLLQAQPPQLQPPSIVSSPPPLSPRSEKPSPSTTITFIRVVPQPPTTTLPKSLLTQLLSSQNSSSPPNPFSSLYASLVSRAQDSLKLSLFFPHSIDGKKGKMIDVGVRKDVSVEEVIGVGLLRYWDEGWEPALKEEEETVRWNLRIVEDDGEVDEDFPALDRTRAISAFSFNMFAIVKATPQQIKDNSVKQSTIQRRPSRVLASQRRPTPVKPTLPVPALQPPPTTVIDASFRPGTTIGVSSALAIPVLLKVRLPPTPGVEAIETTIQVPNDMYMSDVLDHLCKKRGLEHPKDWALVVLPEPNETEEIVVPLDRTVDSLRDRHSLKLVRRIVEGNTKGKVKPSNTNPSASIFKRLSEPPQPKYKSASDITSTYKRYNVQRKLPMPLGRHPRTIAIDGDYIHFLPTETKGGLLDGGRTSSFHISNVHDCKVSRRAPATFKILVQKDRVEKRYDFEGESSKQAAEIVGNIKALLTAWRAGHV